MKRAIPTALLFLLAAWAAGAQTYSPSVGDDHPDELLFGDTHVHSSFSMDASAVGNTRLTPADAYRFARGEPVQAYNGMTAKLTTPLDFLVVSDHAEYMGLLPKLRARDRRLLAHPDGKKLDQLFGTTPESAQAFFGTLIASLMRNDPLIDDDPIKRSIWDEITRLADEHNDPGNFTTLIGYEWTSMPGGDNLHRVVIYADGAERARQLIPASAFDGDRPEDLWNFMRRYEQKTNGRILAIPHNANLSNGRMFAILQSNGEAFDERYARERARLEPIVEVTQIKGDGEVHPLLSPDDEFADFETWDKGNLNVGGTIPKQHGMLRYEYARSALLLGLDEERRLGVNPYRFGMIGSTDAHTSFATGAEDNFWGKASSLEPSPTRVQGVFFASSESTDFDIMAWQQVASGYAAVWATENTREAIFDAFQRREVYATTGSRISVRFFGGWEYEEAEAYHHDVARIGYAKGVPMGGVLPEKKAPAPRFLVSAARDPNGANLDRIQIVKGWIDRNGNVLDRVYDVALSDGRSPGFTGRIKKVESTVDLETATYTNDVGDAQLLAWWEDPYFDPAELAFYYARVIEIPTPRWPVYDRARLGAELPKEAKLEVQDRAYTSPIWYTPKR